MSDSMLVVLSKAEGCKCKRCWKYSLEVGRLVKWPETCYRCVDFLEQLGEGNPIYQRLQEQLTNHPIRQLTLVEEIPRFVHKNGLVELFPRNYEEAPWLLEKGDK